MTHRRRYLACLLAAGLAASSCTLADDGEKGGVAPPTGDEAPGEPTAAPATDGGAAGAAANVDDPAVGETTDPGAVDSGDRITMVVEREQLSEAARAFVPLQMHYLARYFDGVAGSTETELAIGRILDGSPGARAVFRSALSAYRSMPLEQQHLLFDPEMVDLTADTAVMIDRALVNDRLGSIGEQAVLAVPDPPAVPTGLVARNTSLYAGIGGDSDQPETYRISLDWNDTAAAESGFRIYRSLVLTRQPVLVGTVGPDITHFDDLLEAPPPGLEISLSYCYQVTAFTEAPFVVTGQDPIVVESEPTTVACSEYWPPADDVDRSDVDGDGIIAEYDDCPDDAGSHAAVGCPDEDGDGWSDVPDRYGNVDHCNLVTYPHDPWGDTWWDESGVHPLTGCPYLFAVSWMGMEVTSNSAEYVKPLYDVANPDGTLPSILYMNEVDEFPGEEPYLAFSWTNGLTPDGIGPHGSSEWCCGEGVDVAAGDVWEPDGTVLAEAEGADLAVDTEILDHGLPVFPPQSISRTGGMELTIAMLERDWTAMVRESQEADVGDMLEVGLTIIDVGSCVYAPTVWCLIDAAELVVDIIESIFGMADAWVEVDDPDDWMGDGVWGITRGEALRRTSETGAYGFRVEIPWQRGVVCETPMTPCPEAAKIPVGVVADVYLCLHRAQVPTDQITTACGPLATYERVLPWPMEPPDAS